MGPTRMAKIESAMRVVLEFNDAFNRHDVVGMMHLMTDDCVFENTNPAPDGTVYSGKEGVTQFWQNFFRGSPNAHIEIEEILGVGERCIMRWKYSWKDAQGEHGHIRGVDVFRMNYPAASGRGIKERNPKVYAASGGVFSIPQRE